MKFNIGKLVATPNALAHVTWEEIMMALSRHVIGDWGDLCEEDRKENDFSLNRNLRLLSAYRTKDGEKFYIITEADRSATTVLMPEDY